MIISVATAEPGELAHAWIEGLNYYIDVKIFNNNCINILKKLN